MRDNIFILLLITIIFNVFYLIPWAFIPGVFNIEDVGIVLLGIGLIVAVFKGKKLSILTNPISWLIFLYFCLIGVHVALATIYYDQSIINGVIAVRKQLFYLSFFLFLLKLDSFEQIISLLNFLSIIAVLVLFLSILDYLGLTLFHHLRAEDWEVYRSGIKRAFIPGMPLLNFCLIWQLCRWLHNKKDNFAAAVTLILLGGHIFHQSRGQIIGFIGVMVVVFLLTRNYKKLAFIGVVVGLAAIVAGVSMEENIVIAPITTTVEDISKGTGTVRGRLEQIKIDIIEFKEHPWIGSGLIAIRTSKFSNNPRIAAEMKAKARKADLGYSHWLKMYGMAGVIWLAGLYYYLGTIASRAYRVSIGDSRIISLFCIGYLTFIVISAVTLNHFMRSERIILLCLMSAILCRTYYQEKIRLYQNSSKQGHVKVRE